MIVRRFAAGLAVAAFTVPLLAAAPHPRTAPASAATAANAPELPRTSERILARADAAPASPSPVASPSPAASADPAQTAKARAEYDAWAAGKPDMSHYIAGASAELTAAIPQVQAYLQAIGPVKTFAFQRTTTAQGMTVAIYLATAEKGSAQELISWDAAGKIQLIFFHPGQG